MIKIYFMWFKKITFRHFRSFKNQSFYFNPFLNIILGKNAVGKTNLIEGIMFCLQGEGFREEKEEELIFQGKNSLLVEGELKDEEKSISLKIILIKKNSFSKKEYFVEGKKKRKREYLDHSLPVVVFSPSFLRIIDGEPSLRRNFFDRIISRIDFEYNVRLTNFETALRKRNKILEKEEDIEKIKEELVFWDDYLERQAEYITQKRKELVDFFNNLQPITSRKFFINYKKNEFTKKKASLVFHQEIKQKKTLIGPQKDEFEFFLKEGNLDINLRFYGSRSQQKLVFLWMLVNQNQLFQKKLNKKPIFLLDDVFSEFDISHQKLVFEMIKKQQTFITTTQSEILNFIDFPYLIINL